MSVVEQAIDRLRRSEPTPVAIGSLVRKTPATADTSPPTLAPTRHIAIDREALRSAGYLPEQGKDRQFADYYRQIKRPLIAKAMAASEADGASPRLIMLASALPGDGKTFTSINLALSMSRERDVSVVLVDADVAKPHISRIFGVEQEPGLLEALNDATIDVESLVLATDVPGLYILPAGKLHDGATELLASERMTQVTARLNARDSKRITLFDSAPLLVSSESRVLAAITGQLVLVVRAGKTPRKAVLDAIAQAGAGRSISLVLNQGHAGDSDGNYGVFGYGYSGYGDNRGQDG
jgi:protein-tyrosine kinase